MLTLLIYLTACFDNFHERNDVIFMTMNKIYVEKMK